MNYKLRNQRLLFAMKQTKTSQREIAEDMGITQPYVWTMLNKNEETDSIQLVESISKITGFPKVWLMWGSYKMIQEELEGSIDLLVNSFGKKKK